MPRSRIRKQFGGAKSKSNLLVLLIPSVDRNTSVSDALEMLGTHFAGATALPQARGVWRDDDQAGRLVFDSP